MTEKKAEHIDVKTTIDIDKIAKEIIGVERQCFYGDEPERDRLKKIREKLNTAMTD